jgi:type IV pilus assembly protein PilC
MVTGERVATSRQALAALLRNEQILPVRIDEQKQAKGLRVGKGGRVRGKDLGLFTKQFSVMIDAGLPLIQCLEILASQQERAAFKNTIESVQEDVEAGATLADALRRHPKVFDNLFCNMVAAGEAGGVLDVILRRLNTFIEKAIKLKRSVVSASVYPGIVALVAAVIVSIILIFVVPIFASLFEGLGAQLPLLTRIVMKASDYMVMLSIPLVVLTVVAVLGIRYAYNTEEGKFFIDKQLLQIPLIGTVLKKIAIARFSLTLSTLLSSGIPLLDGLEITADTAGNSVIKKTLMNIRKDVAEGKTLVEPIKRAAIFPSMVTQLVSVGEQTGELDQMFEKLAAYYDEEADIAIANLMTLIEPVMIVFLGVIVGGIVVSMYLPIFTLIGNLASQ